MSAVPRVLEAGKFKRVEAGYVLRPPSASFLHRTQAYRVNQAQKAEILSRAALEKGRWTPWLTRCALALAVASGVAVHAVGATLWHSVLVGFGVFLVATIVAPNRAASRRLQPLLVGLPRSDE
jgi:hypothetical protein